MTALKDVRQKKENLKNINAMKLICEDMNDILGDVVAGIIPNRTLVERNLSSCREVYVSFLLEHARKNHESNKLRIRYEIECPSCRTSFMFKAGYCKKCGYVFSKEDINNAEMDLKSKRLKENDRYRREVGNIKKILA